MKRIVLALALAAAPGGCGDNSVDCGPGTQLDDTGFCVNDEACGPGTVVDPATGTCQIDGALCHDGTVYVPGRGCVDPATSLTSDLAEGSEPNGLGVVEASDTPAGEIALKPTDAPFVIQGAITPFRDGDANSQLDPDVDTYLMAVTAPTLIEISVDGTNGLVGGFEVSTAPGNPAAPWHRFGLSVSGDLALRSVWLPSAGTYRLAITDTRSLALVPGAPVAAAGGPDARYYATVTVKTAPAPTAIAMVGKVGTVTGTLGIGELGFYTAPLGAATNDLTLAVPATPVAALVVLDGTTFRGEATETTLPARLMIAGFGGATSPLIIADTVYHHGPGPTPFQLTVRVP